MTNLSLFYMNYYSTFLFYKCPVYKGENEFDMMNIA